MKKKYSSMFKGMRKEVDPEAFTVEEIAREIGLSISQASKRAKQMVAEGAWEETWRKGMRGFVRAYRPKP